MTKFKVGDKVRILNASEIIGGDEHWNDGDIVKVSKLDGVVWLERSKTQPTVRHPFLHRSEHRYVELLSDRPTKNQRITTLESEVAELKAKVEALEKAQSPTKTVTQNITVKTDADVSKIAEQLTKAIAEVSARPRKKMSLTPNEQRKAIIAEAKAFVKQYSGVIPDNTTPYTTEAGDTIVKLFVNEKKRTVTAIPHLVHVNYDEVDDKKFAKCAPDDVFNADIGKAIALGRALGLDVSRFEQAVKPTEFAVGQIVHKTQGILSGSIGPVTSVGDTSFAMGEAGLTFTGDKSINGEYVWAYKKDVEIIDDTEAVY